MIITNAREMSGSVILLVNDDRDSVVEDRLTEDQCEEVLIAVEFFEDREHRNWIRRADERSKSKACSETQFLNER